MKSNLDNLAASHVVQSLEQHAEAVDERIIDNRWY